MALRGLSYRGPLRDIEHDADIVREHGVLVGHCYPSILPRTSCRVRLEHDVHRLERVEPRGGEGAVLQRSGGAVRAVDDPRQRVRPWHLGRSVSIDVDPCSASAVSV